MFIYRGHCFFAMPLSPSIIPQTGLSVAFYEEAFDVIHGFLERIERGEPQRTIAIAKGFLAREAVPLYRAFLTEAGYGLPPEDDAVRARIASLDAVVGTLNSELKTLSKATERTNPLLQEEYLSIGTKVYTIGEIIGLEPSEQRHPRPSSDIFSTERSA